MDVLVIAKEPVSGRVKTRLCPPCSPVEAARLAEAALVDTLAAARASAARQVVVALDGRPGDWLPPGLRIVSQGSGSFDQRLAHAWRHMTGPAVQIGMDTPQVTPADLDDAFTNLAGSDTDAVLGLAEDGGWWLVGLQRPKPEAFVGVPTSRADTGARQRDRLRRLGLRVRMVGTRRDVDTIEDADAVATAAPWTRFAATFQRLDVAARSREPLGRAD